MFIIKFKDGTQAITYEIANHKEDVRIVMYRLNQTTTYAFINEIDKIVRLFE